MTPTTPNPAINLAISLLPVVTFLGALIALDSFKLVRFRWVFLAIMLGSVMAAATLWLSYFNIGQLDVSIPTYTRYVAPVLEETLKSIFVIFLITRKRVGFIVDTAIYGFAIGTGFALVENVYYFKFFADPEPLLWILRGFGTAVMHCVATSTMGIVSKLLMDRYSRVTIRLFLPGLFLPGLLLAVVIHSLYNHLFIAQWVSPVAILVAFLFGFPVVFNASGHATREWLGVRFDTDAELLEMIKTGRITESRVGAYLKTLQSRFPGEVVADMLCMLRLHLELSIRAKGMLLMHEAGFKVPRDPEVEASFRELKFLEKSIGKTGLLAIKPVLNYGDKDLWQLYMVSEHG